MFVLGDGGWGWGWVFKPILVIDLRVCPSQADGDQYLEQRLLDPETFIKHHF